MHVQSQSSLKDDCLSRKVSIHLQEGWFLFFTNARMCAYIASSDHRSPLLFMAALIFFSYERHNSLFCWTTCVGAYNTAAWKCVIAWKCEMWANVCTYWSSPEQLGIGTSKAFRGCVWWGTSVNWFLVAGSLSHWLTNFNCLLLYSASKPMQSKCAMK